jgi:hypothetical protein
MLEILSLLNPRRSHLIRLPSGRRKITPEMVASACAGMRPIVYAYSLAVGGGHPQALRIVSSYAADLVKKELGKKAPEAEVSAIVELLISEIITPKRKRGERKMAKSIGVSHYRWRRYYAKSWNHLLGEFQSIEIEAEDHLTSRIWGRYD